MGVPRGVLYLQTLQNATAGAGSAAKQRCVYGQTGSTVAVGQALVDELPQSLTATPGVARNGG